MPVVWPLLLILPWRVTLPSRDPLLFNSASFATVICSAVKSPVLARADWLFRLMFATFNVLLLVTEPSEFTVRELP